MINLAAVHEHGYSLEEKTVFIWTDEDLDAALAGQAARNILMLDTLAPSKPLTIVLNSPGGSTVQGLALYDIIKDCASHVIIKVYGEASSVAAWILQAGDTRLLSPNSRMMVHVGTEVYEESHPEVIKNWVEFNSKIVEARFEQIIYDRIKLVKPRFTMAQLRKLLLFDTVFTPERALSYNLIDGII